MKNLFFILGLFIFIANTSNAQTFFSEKKTVLVGQEGNTRQYNLSFEKNTINIQENTISIPTQDLQLELDDDVDMFNGEEMSWKTYKVSPNNQGVVEVQTNTFFDNQVESIVVIYEDGREISFNIPIVPNL